MGFVRMSDAQRLYDEPDVVSVISARVDNPSALPAIAHDIEQAAGKGFMTTNWTDQNRELFRALKLDQYVTFIVIGLIVIVAALNILIALTMMVMEKTRDIAVMMSFMRAAAAGAANLSDAGIPDQRGGHRIRPFSGLPCILGWRPIPDSTFTRTSIPSIICPSLRACLTE